MARSTKDAWLTGPADLQEADVDDVPVPGQSVRVRGLPAAYSNRAASSALKLVTGPRGDQTATVDKEKMEVLQFHLGCIDPQFTEAEAAQIAQRFGPAFNKVIQKIDELSGVDKASLEDAEVRFPVSGEAETRPNLGNGTPAGDSGPALHLRASA